jgi:hypothetical protein
MAAPTDMPPESCAGAAPPSSPPHAASDSIPASVMMMLAFLVLVKIFIAVLPVD